MMTSRMIGHGIRMLKEMIYNMSRHLGAMKRVMKSDAAGAGVGDDYSSEYESNEEDNAIDSKKTDNRYSFSEMKEVIAKGRRKKRKRATRVSMDGNNEG